MKINTNTGTHIIEDDEMLSLDAMNEMIRSVTKNDAEFLRLSKASTSWPEGITNSDFIDRCKQWASIPEILTFSSIDPVMFGDFEPCKGRWGLDTAAASEIDLSDVMEEMEKQISSKTGHPAAVELFHSNGHAINGENPGTGTFIATRRAVAFSLTRDLRAFNR